MVVEGRQSCRLGGVVKGALARYFSLMIFFFLRKISMSLKVRSCEYLETDSDLDSS